ncbi:hypothetical protein HMPREF1596_01969 [Escherichia coli 907700]|nr:hypothetical protein HMPREF1594_01306 [Escherichia coli 907446]ESD13189.1 hypothetical protein HMPREF1596_01969 [Escherichia coli 907700]ESD53589.1 hypothetical protein HMPREF1607_03939 [Escherichia coli 908524]ESE03913.1 hypothetical protein HMPREF1615_03474 [Escherichia coli 908632]
MAFHCYGANHGKKLTAYCNFSRGKAVFTPRKLVESCAITT